MEKSAWRASLETTSKNATTTIAMSMPNPTAKIVLVYLGRRLNSVMRRLPTTWPTRSPKYAIAPATTTISRIVTMPVRLTASRPSDNVTGSHFRSAREQPKPRAEEQHVGKPGHFEGDVRTGAPDRETGRGHHVEAEDDENADAEAGTRRRALRTDAERHGEQGEDEARKWPREFIVVGDQQEIVARRIALSDATVQQLRDLRTAHVVGLLLHLDEAAWVGADVDVGDGGEVLLAAFRRDRVGVGIEEPPR